jgi:hypothetical protein
MENCVEGFENINVNSSLKATKECLEINLRYG